jgi:type I restriction-modification system DNA methylase subunit
MSINVAENIEKLAPEIQGIDALQADIHLGDKLAQALGWTSNGATIEQFSPLYETTELLRGVIGNQPAVVFVSGQYSVSRELIDTAALFAYHKSIEWGLVTNSIEITVFNSHWIKDNDWFQLPPIKWNNPRTHIEILEAITPDGLTTGNIENIATRYYEPDKLLLPVDNALVERLDFWRDEALRHTQDIDAIDAKLQTLFAQLFVLRAIEDRNLASDLPNLETTCNQFGEADLSKLEMLFTQAKNKIQSELFDERVFQDFPTFVLGGIIHDLYFPYEFPRREFRYNFSWINADVLGSAYEKYLSTLLVPLPTLSPQLRLFEQPLREVDRVSVQKKSGVYYTPSFLVNYLTESSLDYYFETVDDHMKLPRIADLSCGSGSFLATAVDSLIRRLRSFDEQKNWGRELVDKKCIVGIDNDQRAVTLARLSLWLRLTEEPDPLPLPRLEETIICGDSLSEETFADIPTEYDIVLGNPPFIATGRFPNREQLAAKFQTAQGRFDFSYLFVELAIQTLKENGILGMVVPNRLYRNKGAETIRDILVNNMKLLSLVDFGSTEVFTGTNAYIGTIIAQKKPARLFENSVRVIKVRELPPRFISVRLFEADLSDDVVSTRYLNAFNTPHPPDAASWMLLSPNARQVLVQLENSSETLDTIAGIYQGIKTAANDIFVVEIVSYTNGPLVQIRNQLGEVFLIEETILYPVIYGSDIKRYDIIEPHKYLIYPYHSNSVIPEAELRKQFPHTYAYFSAYQSLLTDRRSIEVPGRRWYELASRRDVSWLQSQKLLIRDLATKPAFALDNTGSTFLIGGTAVVPAEPDLLLPLLGYLNSGIVDWYLRQITPSFRSGFQKFEPQHLRRIPILSEIITQSKLSEEIADLVLNIIESKKIGAENQQKLDEEQIDSLLLEYMGLDIFEIQQ